MATRDTIKDLQARMEQSIIGQADVVERLIVCLLADGNLLLEGLPGLAKTRAVKSLAANLSVKFSRIQFTPDLLPSDITGTEMYYASGGKDLFEFQPGPIFSNLILADEINRAPAKVQSALLEAMEERQVTVAGKTHKLERFFMVLATQNPIEQEGTYPLPEAQMDRFLMHVRIGYPGDEDELGIIRLVRGEQGAGQQPPQEAIAQETVFAAREEISAVYSSDAVDRYVVALVSATRHPEKYDKQLAGWLEVGASPRGSLALDKCSRVHAWLHGRDHVLPDDVRAVVHDCLRHRLILSYEANAAGVNADQVIDAILKLVAVA
ncbi:AAA family ATPase [Fundidesulfovibrio agrisoli]|uniref:AAA family ATPase n=1 Tax=Fundidesulfovibrio agrisoli TaxID=2922717 RepID=UPI001FADCC37|nr:MoxR family ATPase [Fundidesulfovibrio agrisoli]